MNIRRAIGNAAQFGMNHKRIRAGILAGILTLTAYAGERMFAGETVFDGRIKGRDVKYIEGDANGLLPFSRKNRMVVESGQKKYVFEDTDNENNIDWEGNYSPDNKPRFESDNLERVALTDTITGRKVEYNLADMNYQDIHAQYAKDFLNPGTGLADQYYKALRGEIVASKRAEYAEFLDGVKAEFERALKEDFGPQPPSGFSLPSKSPSN